jgi:hypothetical protein
LNGLSLAADAATAKDAEKPPAYKKTDAPKGTSVDILGPRKRPAYVGREKKKAAGIFLSPLAKP